MVSMEWGDVPIYIRKIREVPVDTTDLCHVVPSKSKIFYAPMQSILEKQRKGKKGKKYAATVDRTQDLQIY